MGTNFGGRGCVIQLRKQRQADQAEEYLNCPICPILSLVVLPKIGDYTFGLNSLSLNSKVLNLFSSLVASWCLLGLVGLLVACCFCNGLFMYRRLAGSRVANYRHNGWNWMHYAHHFGENQIDSIDATSFLFL